MKHRWLTLRFWKKVFIFWFIIAQFTNFPFYGSILVGFIVNQEPTYYVDAGTGAMYRYEP